LDIPHHAGEHFVYALPLVSAWAEYGASTEQHKNQPEHKRSHVATPSADCLA